MKRERLKTQLKRSNDGKRLSSLEKEQAAERYGDLSLFGVFFTRKEEGHKQRYESWFTTHLRIES